MNWMVSRGQGSGRDAVERQNRPAEKGEVTAHYAHGFIQLTRAWTVAQRCVECVRGCEESHDEHVTGYQHT